MVLKQLTINNLILVEHASVEFGDGLNIITGETGAGKSAILQALKLLAGDRFDTSVLRHGCEKGWTEAAFDNPPAELLQLLEQSGISHQPDDPLILRRELSAAGKSRCFINNQLAQKNLLQEAAHHLLHIVGQHASRELLQPDQHRQTLDRFGELTEESKQFAMLWQKEKSLSKELEELLASEKERLRAIETLEREIEELSQAQLKKGEEEELFEEYSLLMNAENILQHAQEFTQLLQGDSKSILSGLVKAKRTLEKLVGIVPSLTETTSLLHNAEVELQEAVYMVSQHLGNIENNPQRSAAIDERLSELNRLKKRYGNDVESMMHYLAEAQGKLAQLENSDEAIATLRNALQDIQNKQNDLAETLSKKRKKAAAILSKSLTEELQQLNMPHVEFLVQVSPSSRHAWGDDEIEFYLKPNLGEKMVPLRQCASGGELSRVVLALQYLLSKKDNDATLIFDEIDSNIGGETASVVGKKLQGIGEQRQVICVTHFPQVASYAHHHLGISKSEVNGRTQTTVRTLDSEGLQLELRRMAGGRLH